MAPEKVITTPMFVIPAKAGIHYFRHLTSSWIPAFAGMTANYECIKK